MGIGDPGTPEERFNRWVRKELSDLRSLLQQTQEEVAALRSAIAPPQPPAPQGNPHGVPAAVAAALHGAQAALAAQERREVVQPPPCAGPAHPNTVGDGPLNPGITASDVVPQRRSRQAELAAIEAQYGRR